MRNTTVIIAGLTLASLSADPAESADRRYYSVRKPLVIHIQRPMSIRDLENSPYGQGTQLPSQKPGNSHPWFAKKFYDYSDRYNSGGSSN
jgi:hypothetical protein